MRIGGGLAVIADSDGDEVILDVGVIDACAGANEGAAFELVGRSGAGAGEEPLRADKGFAEKIPVFVKGYGLGRGHLDIHFQMVLQVLAHARTVGDHGDAVFGEVAGGADAGEHQEFRRVDRGGGEDDLGPGGDDLGAVATVDFDAGGAVVVDEDPAGEAADDGGVAGLDAGRR